MDDRFTRPYDPKATEKRVYDAWEESGHFNPDTLPPELLSRTEGTPYTVMMPPPNATGKLHMAHALGFTVQDTLDGKRNRAVNELFKRMYDAGLIYRGYRIVNWDPKGQTTISDDEIVYEE